jgi:hypothetical protein
MPWIRPPRHGLARVVLTSPLIMPPTDAFQGNSSNTSISAALLRVGSSTPNIFKLDQQRWLPWNSLQGATAPALMNKAVLCLTLERCGAISAPLRPPMFILGLVHNLTTPPS